MLDKGPNVGKSTNAIAAAAKAATASLTKARNAKKNNTTNAGGISPEAMDRALKSAGLTGPLGAAAGATVASLSSATNGFQNLAGIKQADFTTAFNAVFGGGDLYTA